MRFVTIRWFVPTTTDNFNAKKKCLLKYQYQQQQKYWKESLIGICNQSINVIVFVTKAINRPCHEQIRSTTTTATTTTTTLAAAEVDKEAITTTTTSIVSTTTSTTTTNVKVDCSNNNSTTTSTTTNDHPNNHDDSQFVLIVHEFLASDIGFVVKQEETKNKQRKKNDNNNNQRVQGWMGENGITSNSTTSNDTTLNDTTTLPSSSASSYSSSRKHFVAYQSSLSSTNNSSTIWNSIHHHPNNPLNNSNQQQQSLTKNPNNPMNSSSSLYNFLSLQQYYQKIQTVCIQSVSHFLPANFPHSVASGYLPYAWYCFIGSVAGSASMVLSTQALLLAVVGGGNGGGKRALDNSPNNPTNPIHTKDDDQNPEINLHTNHSESKELSNTISDPPLPALDGCAMDESDLTAQAISTTAGIMAGAFNWVLKDGIGQLGGIWFASYVAKIGGGFTLDSNPRYWRMVAALSLDCAAILELLSPLLLFSPESSLAILPVACASTVLKNIGFLTASASRAAIHQSLITLPGRSPHAGGNLADVTAKSGSQSMLAGLLGTTVGIALSSTVLSPQPSPPPLLLDTIGAVPMPTFWTTFCVLAIIHQTCTYKSLQNIAVRTMNPTRMKLVLDHAVDQIHNVPIKERIQQHQQQQSQPPQQYQTNPPYDYSNNIHKSHPTNAPLTLPILQILSPEQVAPKEPFVPILSTLWNKLNTTIQWEQQSFTTQKNNNNNNMPSIVIGSNLPIFCPGGSRELMQLQKCFQDVCDDTQLWTTNDYSSSLTKPVLLDAIPATTTSKSATPIDSNETYDTDNHYYSHAEQYFINVTTVTDTLSPLQQQQQQGSLLLSWKTLFSSMSPTTTTNASKTRNIQIHLVFLEHATGLDLIKGKLHALLLQRFLATSLHCKSKNSTTNTEPTTDSCNSGYGSDSISNHHKNDDYYYPMIHQTYQTTNQWFPQILQQLHQVGWNTNTDVTTIEPLYAKRLSIAKLVRK